MLEVQPGFRIPQDEIEFTFARSSGPGGQNVNKVNTKAILHWHVVGSPSIPPDLRDRVLAKLARRITHSGHLVIQSQRYRDQSRNVGDCLEKLRELLASVATMPKKRRPTRPSRAASRRRLENKRQQSLRKQGRRGVGHAD